MRQLQTRWSGVQVILVALLFTVVALGAGHISRAGAESTVGPEGTQRFDAQMQPILESYLRIATTLSNDSLEGVRKEAQVIAKQARGLDSTSVSGEHAAHYKDIPVNLKKAAEAVGRAKTLDEARDSFKSLSMPMAMWATMSKPKDVDVLYCSMAKASWVQRHGNVRNPYYGSAMLKCGQVVTRDSSQGQNR
jgi:Cu(I)/Ag(I) efflux system membrane fusion protein